MARQRFQAVHTQWQGALVTKCVLACSETAHPEGAALIRNNFPSARGYGRTLGHLEAGGAHVTAPVTDGLRKPWHLSVPKRQNPVGTLHLAHCKLLP